MAVTTAKRGAGDIFFRLILFHIHSYTAASFVPYYAQRLSAACVIYGAAGILDALKTVRADRLRAA